MTANYSQSSAYYTTPVVGKNSYLSTWNPRSVPVSSSDKLFTINSIYDLRPDLLAHDLYGDARLWWVFAVRNPNTLRDPLGDFTVNAKIFLPNAANLKTSLGL